jgi:uncharacterized protein (DUF779 family)
VRCDQAPACSITATPEARETLRQLKSSTATSFASWRQQRSALADLPACWRTQVGARDELLGVVDGVPIYQMQSRPNGECRIQELVIDMVDGFPVGFSLATGSRRRFTIYCKPETQSHTTSAAHEPNVIGADNDDY